nr:WD repeat-containing protein 31 [Pogona vitticeps]
MGKRQSKPRCNSSKYREEETKCPSLPEAALRDQPAHTDAVASVASLAHDQCVSGGKDKAVVVCNWHRGNVVRRFWGHEHEVTKVGCLAELGFLFSASRDRTVKMWGLSSGALEEARCFSGHELVVSGLAVSPAFPRLCTGSRDNSVCTWDLETGACLQRVAISRNVVTHLCWVPGEPYVTQTSEDKTIRIWDTRELQVAHLFPAKKQIQTSCDVSPDGRYCLSTSSGFGHEGGEATLWDLRQVKGRVREFWGHAQTASSCIFLPQGLASFPEIVTASHDGTVKVWSLETGACLSTAFLDGALSSLAACGKATFLCGSSTPWIHLMRVRSAKGPELQQVAKF